MQYLFHLKHEDTAKPPITKLVTLLFKALRLSQASLEFSSSRGVFGNQENERDKREKRENFDLKNKSCGKAWIKVKLGLQKL